MLLGLRPSGGLRSTDRKEQHETAQGGRWECVGEPKWGGGAFPSTVPSPQPDLHFLTFDSSPRATWKLYSFR